MVVIGLERRLTAIRGENTGVGDPLTRSDPQERGSGHQVGEGLAENRHRP